MFPSFHLLCGQLHLPKVLQRNSHPTWDFDTLPTNKWGPYPHPLKLNKCWWQFWSPEDGTSPMRLPKLAHRRQGGFPVAEWGARSWCSRRLCYEEAQTRSGGETTPEDVKRGGQPAASCASHTPSPHHLPAATWESQNHQSSPSRDPDHRTHERYCWLNCVFPKKDTLES